MISCDLWECDVYVYVYKCKYIQKIKFNIIPYLKCKWYTL